MGEEQRTGASLGMEGMTTRQATDRWMTIWQGFHHAWEYNHRLNRLGSYVRCPSGDANHEALVGHTAASGTGGDTAHFSEFVTRVRAADVGFQAGRAETLIECPRAVTTGFHIRVDDLELAPELVGKERYAVVINGFDLFAEHHADKLISFDLEVTDPVVYADGTRMRFNIMGSLCFDCRTAECQLWPMALEVDRVGRRGRPPRTPKQKKQPDSSAGERAPKRGIKKRPVIEQGVNWLKRQVAAFTDLENVKESIVGRGDHRLRRRLFRLFGRKFFLRLSKWRMVTPYVLRVEYAILGGASDALAVTESTCFEYTYDWDAEQEIEREEVGTGRIAVVGDSPDAYDVNTFGFKALSLETTLDQHFGASNPIQWGRGMHLLEWDAAVRDVEVVAGRVTGRLDLFYKSWSEAMNEVITLTTWGAVRSAGSARLGARLALLQFKEAQEERLELPGRIHWPGGGLNARDHPRALHERSTRGVKGTTGDG